MRLVLASASPRRAELLRAAGYTFETLPLNLDETVRPGEAPGPYVERLAGEKSSAAMQRFLARAQQACRAPERDRLDEVLIIGADTAVVVDGEILGKPRDREDNATMLRKLSGRSHEVLTGVSVRSSTNAQQRIESTRVYMLELSDVDIEWYVASGEGNDKAGGYAVQGLASRFVPHIDGSYSNVVGLPVATVAELLREAGYAR